MSFSLNDGDQFGLVGPNGAGKSTLFDILMSKITKTSGSIFL